MTRGSSGSGPSAKSASRGRVLCVSGSGGSVIGPFRWVSGGLPQVAQTHEPSSSSPHTTRSVAQPRSATTFGHRGRAKPPGSCVTDAFTAMRSAACRAPAFYRSRDPLVPMSALASQKRQLGSILGEWSGPRLLLPAACFCSSPPSAWARNQGPYRWAIRRTTAAPRSLLRGLSPAHPIRRWIQALPPLPMSDALRQHAAV